MNEKIKEIYLKEEMHDLKKRKKQMKFNGRMTGKQIY